MRDDKIVIRPITPENEEFYRSIRTQYSIMYKSACDAAKEKGGNLFISEISPPEEFYCIIEKDDVPAGYLGTKDTSTDLWEIAIELDAKHTRQGLGSRSIRLYLNEIQRITGKGEFKAVVEVNNLPSQKCFERLSAKLVGLCGSVVLNTDEEKRKFEEGNLGLIDTHMIELTGRLGAEPRVLLSHLLDYREQPRSVSIYPIPPEKFRVSPFSSSAPLRECLMLTTPWAHCIPEKNRNGPMKSDWRTVNGP